ncbi:MAG: class I SAM-dependent methyltransferase [Pseudomonadota bacterium]
MLTRFSNNKIIGNIISGYDSKIVKAYCWCRFKILHQRFLEEIEQYLPKQGKVLDIGSGFGLFSLYYAQKHPELTIYGIDLDLSRTNQAKQIAAKLSIKNVEYINADVRDFNLESNYDGVYMLDIIHHIPPDEVKELLKKISYQLKPNSRLIIKDVDTEPAYKLWFTHILDKIMYPGTIIHYWKRSEIMQLLQDLGFKVYYHYMIDFLPYPHIMYICEKIS